MNYGGADNPALHVVSQAVDGVGCVGKLMEVVVRFNGDSRQGFQLSPSRSPVSYHIVEATVKVHRPDFPSHPSVWWQSRKRIQIPPNFPVFGKALWRIGSSPDSNLGTGSGLWDLRPPPRARIFSLSEQSQSAPNCTCRSSVRWAS